MNTKLNHLNPEGVNSMPKVQEQLGVIKDILKESEHSEESSSSGGSDVLISTIYIEQGISDDFIKITGDVAVNTDAQGNIQYTEIDGGGRYGFPSHKPSSTNVFSWIRENSKRVHGKWNKTLGIFKYIETTEDSLADDELTGATGAFIIIPAFYWKCENVDANHSVVKVAKDYPGEDWNYYDGKYAIPQYKVSGTGSSNSAQKNSLEDGVTLGLAILNGTGSISIGGSIPDIYISQQAGVALAKTLGEGWSLINYEIHKIITLLCIGYYGSIDVRNYIGKAGTNSSQSQYSQDISNVSFHEDENNSKLFDSVSTKSGVSVEPDNTCLWGIVDWYNNVYEWVEDVMNCGHIKYDDENPFGAENNIAIVENKLVKDENDDYILEKNIKRVIKSISDPEFNSYFGTNAILGKDFDLFPSEDSGEVDSDENSIKGWSCRFYSSGVAGCVARQSSRSCGPGCGLAYFSINGDAGSADGYYGLRLLYHGEMIETTEEYFDD